MMRAFIARLLLLIEALIIWPVFAVSWFACAIWQAAKGGYDFSKVADGNAKAAALRKMLGEGASQ